MASAILISDEDPSEAMQSITKVRPIPQGYHSVTPYLIVDGAPRLIEFIKETFDAEERDKMTQPDGKIGHAEMKVGDSIVMLSDATPEFKAMPTMLYVYVEDVDSVYKKALAAGGTSVREPKDQFYGDRSASVRDPLGNHWGIATHVEDVPPDEMQRRIKANMGQ